MCVAAAIAGGALVGAAGTVIAGSESASATKDATNAAIGQQQSALSQQATLSAPYRGVGEAAIPAYEALLGITPAPSSASSSGPTIGGAFDLGIPGLGIQIPQRMQANAAGGAVPATGAPAPNIMQALENTPGYQFALSQGERGIANQASLAGGFSGNTAAALDQFNSGLASETYQQNVDNLARAVGTGQAAAAGQAQNVGNAANNISSALINQGQTTAGIDANTVAGLTKAVGNAADQYGTMSALKALQTQVPASTDPVWA